VQPKIRFWSLACGTTLQLPHLKFATSVRWQSRLLAVPTWQRWRRELVPSAETGRFC